MIKKKGQKNEKKMVYNANSNILSFTWKPKSKKHKT